MFYKVHVCLLLAVILLGKAAASPAEATFNFTYGFNPAVISVNVVNYTDDSGTALGGYLAYDNTTMAQRPAVVIIPDYDGIGPYELWRARLLAQMGYAAFVADIYGVAQPQGPVLTSAQSSALDEMYLMDPDLLLARIASGVAEAQMQAVVKTNATVVIGYCFGAAAVLDLAASWPDAATDNVLGVMGFHVAAPPSAVINMTEGNPIRISVQQGFDDPSVPQNEALSTQQMWDGLGIDWEWTWYSQTVHAFTEPDLVGVNAAATMAYSATADQRSWQALRFFLLDLFSYVTPQNQYTNTTVFDTMSSFA